MNQKNKENENIFKLKQQKQQEDLKYKNLNQFELKGLKDIEDRQKIAK